MYFSTLFTQQNKTFIFTIKRYYLSKNTLWKMMDTGNREYISQLAKKIQT
jgi:hypothetical protein